VRASRSTKLDYGFPPPLFFFVLNTGAVRLKVHLSFSLSFFFSFASSFNYLLLFIMTTHDVHRAMEGNLFGTFQRQPQTFSSSSLRSLTASDLLSLPGQHRHISPIQPRTCRTRPSSEILQAPPVRNSSSLEGTLAK
jgi:hypothetical protein